MKRTELYITTIRFSSKYSSSYSDSKTSRTANGQGTLNLPPPAPHKRHKLVHTQTLSKQLLPTILSNSQTPPWTIYEIGHLTNTQKTSGTTINKHSTPNKKLTRKPVLTLEICPDLTSCLVLEVLKYQYLNATGKTPAHQDNS
jgi:hypothetical protein